MEKIFKDPIYGYVSIPSTYCKSFIDTAIFQRLRRIEQTSMRAVYPSAHHDRFAHSIGVYHLGRIAIRNLIKNTKVYYNFSDEVWLCYEHSFQIACLMHDCGHAPFSHTFEYFYLHKREEEIENKIANFFKDDLNFKDDYKEAASSAHEKISALILLTSFNTEIKKIGADPLLAARMIMGCLYLNDSDKGFENKLISLLNGSSIDVDSLDYIRRDTWVSGVNNVDIDYFRLLSTLTIKPDSNGIPQIVFKKHALSVLESINIGRNFLYKWVYANHKINYEQYLLTTIITELNKENNDELCKSIFSFDSFYNPIEFGNLSYYLVTDDDVIFTLKRYINKNDKIKEYFTRNYKYKALWKTYFEFKEDIFSTVSKTNLMKIKSKTDKGKLCYPIDNYLCLEVKPKLKSINSNDFFIDVNNKLIDAAKATKNEDENLVHFILYVTEDLLPKKNEIIKELIQLQ